ncbi:piggyBac transposable element-derived protein 4 [Aplysia californica]|uniref:PiggyBac transposable element-derived protein 4 n=1 Tax=Aplysia californica TaxID=6500 RepID=A0ABM0JDU4_APLCA|nr:piggyBac transposable element-derived protein 4 [Aplysia californica]
MAFQTLQGWLNELQNNRAQPETSSSDGSESEQTNAESDIDENVIAEVDSDESDVDLDPESDHETENERTEWSETLRDVRLEPFQEPVGPLHNLDENSKPIDFFHLFVPPTFLDEIVVQTNLYAEQCQNNKGKRDTYWKAVTVSDIRKFLYLNIMFGIHHVPDSRLYWSVDPVLRVPAVADVMSRQRFEKINQYFHLNDSTKMPNRGEENYDPLFKLRPLLDTVRTACGSSYKPGRNISIDEAMIGFNGRLHFKQYIRNKPTKWGIKVWCVAEAETGYMLNFRFYTGKINEPMTDGVGHHVVMNCAADYLGKYHCIYFDNYFSSVRLAEDLLKKKTYSCATVRTNRKGWPFPTKNKQKKGTLNMKQRGTMVATQWHDKRPVNVLSTCCNPTTTDVTRRTKEGVVPQTIPTPVHDYNQNMSGVDLADQYRSYYNIGRPGKKWWRYGVWFLIQTAIINAFLLMRRANPNARRRSPGADHLHFRIALLQDLLRETPSSSTTINTRESPSVSARANPNNEQHKLVKIPGRKKTCYVCSKAKRKTNKGRGVETVYGCTYCGIHLCKGRCFTTYHRSLELDEPL